VTDYNNDCLSSPMHHPVTNNAISQADRRDNCVPLTTSFLVICACDISPALSIELASCTLAAFTCLQTCVESPCCATQGYSACNKIACLSDVHPHIGFASSCI
jgi:hypothetical protein